MGQLVAKLANEQGHEVAGTFASIDKDRNAEDLLNSLRGCDVAIDFSVAAAVRRNVDACARAGVPLVEGTTGWNGELDDIKKIVTQHRGALIYGANFSVGVQVFYRIAARAAELFRGLASYDGFIEEAHHKRKRDAPSGTAVQLGKLVSEGLGREVSVTSPRDGYTPATQRPAYNTTPERIT